MATETVTKNNQASNMTINQVQAVVDRAANRLAYLLGSLRHAEENGFEILKVTLFDKRTVDSVIAILCSITWDLKKLHEDLYPDGGKGWSGPDIEGYFCTPISMLDQILEGSYGFLDFPKKATDREVRGVVEIMQDALNELIDLSEKLEKAVRSEQEKTAA